MHDDPTTALLPTLERARALAIAPMAVGETKDDIGALLARDPAESRALAAIVFVADVLRRETWEEDVELAPPLFDRYPREMPPPPEDFRATGYQLIDSTAAQRRRCGNCFLSPGTVICTRCFGQRRADDEGPCRYCNGDVVICSMCDGAGETVRAKLRHINDHPVSIRRAFFPAIPDAVREKVERHVDPTHAPPESHLVALQANVVESAYRGASAVRAPEFHGHAFGAALEAAIDAATEVERYTNAVKREVRAYAWPIVCLRFATSLPEDRWVAVLHDAAGSLQVVG
jgi:hypothetical protein